MFQLQGYVCVQYVVVGYVYMDVMFGIIDVFVYVGEEGDYVVVNFSFNFEDVFYFEVGFGFDGIEGVLGYLVEVIVGFCGGDFYIELVLEFCLFILDGFYFGKGVMFNYWCVWLNNLINLCCDV